MEDGDDPLCHDAQISKGHIERIRSCFGEMAPGLYSANCYIGVGMKRGSLPGKLLVDRALGQPSRELADVIAVSGLPSTTSPDPFRKMRVTPRLNLAAWESCSEM